MRGLSLILIRWFYPPSYERVPTRPLGLKGPIPSLASVLMANTNPIAIYYSQSETKGAPLSDQTCGNEHPQSPFLEFDVTLKSRRTAGFAR